MSNKVTDSLPVEVATLADAYAKHGEKLAQQLLVLIDAPALNSDIYKKGVYHVDSIALHRGNFNFAQCTHLVTGTKLEIDGDDLVLIGVELPVDGDGSNLANVTSQTLAESLNQSAEWHGEAEGTVSQMMEAVMDETATTVNLTDSISVDLQVNGVREQIGAVLGIVSGLFSSSPLREMP